MRVTKSVCAFESDGSFKILDEHLLDHVVGGNEVVVVNRVCPGTNSSCEAAINDNCGNNSQCRGLIPGEINTGLLPPPNYNDYCQPRD